MEGAFFAELAQPEIMPAKTKDRTQKTKNSGVSHPLREKWIKEDRGPPTFEFRLPIFDF
jgi:hypothetical protein